MDKKELLDSIALTGYADDKKAMEHHKIGGNLSHVLNLSSGLPRLQTNVIPRFALILSQPQELIALNPFEIRCCLCHGVIRYPVWYYEVKYVVNHFHYFICFDSSSPNKPTTKCYRKDV